MSELGTGSYAVGIQMTFQEPVNILYTVQLPYIWNIPVTSFVMDLEKQISVYRSQKFLSESVQYYWEWTYSANNEIHHILVNTYAGTTRFFTKMAAIYVDTHFLFAGTTAKKNISASLKLSFASYRYRIKFF